MFGIGGDARLYGSRSIARLAQAEEAVSAVSPGAAEAEAVVDAAVAVGLHLLRLLLGLPSPAWKSSTRS